MCGITGMISLEKKWDKNKMNEVVHTMNNQIIHRGPDSEGIFADDFCALGMRRLSIIDIDNGNQPIWNESHDIVIVFNGEIYNYQELRNELKAKGHDFATNSDTETIVHGYEEYGEAILGKLEGMFSIAIYDLRKKRILLARDKMGEKPLYYSHINGVILFGSELKCLMAANLIEKKINVDAMTQYFQLTYIPAPACIWEGVQKLQAASYLIIDENLNMVEKQYWSLELENIDDRYEDFQFCKRQLREALFHSVEKRMISDVPIGAFLSGGFDSSIVVGIMSRISSSPVNTFTIGLADKRRDESELAQKVAKFNQTNHHVLRLDWNNVVSEIDTILNNIDEPFADSSLIATYAVSKMTKQYATVALTGDAGDELFAGYNKYLISYYDALYKRIPRIIRKSIIEPGLKVLPYNGSLLRMIKKVVNNADLSMLEKRKQLMCLGFKNEELLNLLISPYNNLLSFIDERYNKYSHSDEQLRTQYVDLTTVLEGDMLTKVDRASMLASLETRVPMLDTRVIETAFHIPTKYKINKKQRKIVLKEAFRDMLPEELFSAPKNGFGVPIGMWLETNLRENLLRYSSRSFLEEQGLFDYVYISNMVQRQLKKIEDRYSELWTFYVFQNWYERVMM